MPGKGMFIFVLVFAVFVGGIFFMFGPLGILGMIHNFIVIGFFLVIFGLLFYAIYYVFFLQKRINITALNARKIVESARLSKPALLRDLHVMGDKEHQSARIGNIKGYARIQAYDGTQEDVFVIKRWPFPISLLEEWKIIRTAPDDHTPLVGDVFLKALSLLKIGEYYYINQDTLDFKRIDDTQYSEALRTTAHMGYSDMKTIVDIATGLDTSHTKEMERKKLLPLPKRTEPEERE